MNCIHIFFKTGSAILLAGTMLTAVGCRTTRSIQARSESTSKDSVKENDSLREILNDRLTEDSESWEIVRTEFFANAADRYAHDTVADAPKQATSNIRQITRIRGHRQHVSTHKEAETEKVSQTMQVVQQRQQTETNESVKKSFPGQLIFYLLGLGAFGLILYLAKKKLF